MEKDKGIEAHEASAPHMEAVSKWTQYKQSINEGSIREQLEMISIKYILENRYYIKRIIQTITICAVQDIGLRGHREGWQMLAESTYISSLTVVLETEETFWKFSLHMLYMIQ